MWLPASEIGGKGFGLWVEVEAGLWGQDMRMNLQMGGSEQTDAELGPLMGEVPMEAGVCIIGITGWQVCGPKWTHCLGSSIFHAFLL